MMKNRAVSTVLLRLDPEYKTRSLTCETKPGLTVKDINNLEDTTKLVWHLLDDVENYPSNYDKEISEKKWT